MYVDARLHISVRPALEYRLPDAGRAVRAALLGDRAAKDALPVLEACLGAPPEPVPPPHSTDPALLQLCARVCTHSHDYLHALASAWRADVGHVADEVHRAVQATRRGVSEADAVRARYAGAAGGVVEQEYRAEVARLSRALDAALAVARAAPVPSCPRPAELTRAAEELKDAFSTAYGRASTADLMAVKAHFEAEIGRVEHLVAEDFVRCVALLLH